MTTSERIETLWVYEARWPVEVRKAYKATHPQNFAGPALALPIRDEADVRDAEVLLDQVIEEDRARVRTRIISIATRLGLAHALPKSWQEARA